LQPGESRRVTFTLDTDQLGCWDEGLGYAVRPGVVEVMIGSSSEDVRLRGEFEIAGRGPVGVKERAFFCPVRVG
jgi:beta-glucosidase